MHECRNGSTAVARKLWKGTWCASEVSWAEWHFFICLLAKGFYSYFKWELNLGVWKISVLQPLTSFRTVLTRMADCSVCPLWSSWSLMLVRYTWVYCSTNSLGLWWLQCKYVLFGLGWFQWYLEPGWSRAITNLLEYFFILFVLCFFYAFISQGLVNMGHPC